MDACCWQWLLCWIRTKRVAPQVGQTARAQRYMCTYPETAPRTYRCIRGEAPLETYVQPCVRARRLSPHSPLLGLSLCIDTVHIASTTVATALLLSPSHSLLNLLCYSMSAIYLYSALSCSSLLPLLRLSLVPPPSLLARSTSSRRRGRAGGTGSGTTGAAAAPPAAAAAATAAATAGEAGTTLATGPGGTRATASGGTRATGTAAGGTRVTGRHGTAAAAAAAAVTAGGDSATGVVTTGVGEGSNPGIPDGEC